MFKITHSKSEALDDVFFHYNVFTENGLILEKKLKKNERGGLVDYERMAPNNFNLMLQEFNCNKENDNFAELKFIQTNYKSKMEFAP
mmetsp:Transcript_38897/g.37228  ORF Transcript_38897/g.37228 Transcript_38897/m.37228 type:complete len:87 (-) Transcript_38897:673-933(-)